MDLLDPLDLLALSSQYILLDPLAPSRPLAPNILSSRLAHLTACGILGRRAYQEMPPRYEYRLTEKGLDFYPQNIAMMIWGDRWLSAKKDFASLILKHKPCGAIIVPRTVCRSCGKEITLCDVRTETGVPWATP